MEMILRMFQLGVASFRNATKLRPLVRLDVFGRHLRQSPASGEELSLVKAAKAQDVAKCEEALAKGADVHARDQFGYTALHWAANHGLLELCKLLREKGAEIDPRSNWDETPLIMAARSQKSLPTCDFLVSEGADMQAKTNYSKGARTAKEYLDDYLKELGVSVNCGLGSS